MLETVRSPSEPLSDALLVNALDMICRSGNDLSPVLCWFNGPNLFSRAVALGEVRLLARACRSVSAFSSAHSILSSVGDALEWNASFLSRHPSLWFQQVVNYLADASLTHSASGWYRAVQNGSMHQPMLIHTASWPPAAINAAVASRVDLPSELFVIRHNPARKQSWGVAGGSWLGAIENGDAGYQISLGLSTLPDRTAAMEFVGKDRLVAILQQGKQNRLVRVVIDTTTGQQSREDTGQNGKLFHLSPDGTLVLFEQGHSFRVWDATNGKTVTVPYPPDGVIYGVDRSVEGIPECFGAMEDVNGTAVWHWNLQSKSFSMIPIPVKVISPKVWRSKGGNLYCVHERLPTSLRPMPILVIDRDGNVKKQELGNKQITAVIFDEDAAKVHVVDTTSVRSFDLRADEGMQTYLLGSISPRAGEVSPLNGEIALLNGSTVTVITQQSHASGSQTGSAWPKGIRDFEFDPSGEFFVIAESLSFHVVDADTGDRIFECDRNVYDTKAVRFVRGTSLMVSASPTDAVVRDLSTGEVINEIIDTKAGARPKILVHRGRTAVSVRLGAQVHRIVTDEIAARYAVRNSDVSQVHEPNDYIADIREGEFILSLRATGKEIAWFPLQRQADLRRENIFVKFQPVPWSKRPGRNEWVVWDGWSLRKLCIVASFDPLTQPSP